MWKRRGIRSSPDEVKQLLKEKRLILAEIDGAVVGSVNVNLMSGRIGEFGMLVSDVNHRGKGVGSALVTAADNGPNGSTAKRCSWNY
jgi:N-acetylglutamate synthase-like GNAT family acetyltransferase